MSKDYSFSLQVAWIGQDVAAATWEPESSLPTDLVCEYESGLSREICEVTHHGGGQTVHTLVSKLCNNTPPSKRPRRDNCQLLSSPTGYINVIVYVFNNQV